MDNALTKLENLLRKPTGKACARVNFLLLTRQFTQLGEPRKTRELVQQDPDKLLDALTWFINYFVKDKKEYSSSIWPTLLKFSEASNFKIHKLSPTVDDMLNLWYALLSGLPHRDMIINLLNVDEDTLEEFRGKLASQDLFLRAKPELKEDDIRSSFDNRVLPTWGHPTVLAFSVLNYIAYRAKQEVRETKEGFLDISKFLEHWQIGDKSTMLVVHIPPRGGKSDVRIYSRLGLFLNKWYSDFFQSEDRCPSFGLFVSSLYTFHKDYRDLSASLLEKFLHHLLDGYVSGELLNKLVMIKTEAFIKEKRGGISRAKSFFSKILA